MARGVNKVILVGNLGADPETRYMPSGGAVTNIRIATSESWKDKNTGHQREDTSWHNIVVFNPYLVGICRAYLQKGTRVYLEGELKTRAYDKEGTRFHITEVLVPQVKGELIVIAKGRLDNVNETPGSERRRTSGSGPQRMGDALPYSGTSDISPATRTTTRTTSVNWSGSDDHEASSPVDRAGCCGHHRVQPDRALGHQ